MLITFVRHASAIERSIDMLDADRHLIEKGEKQVKRLASFCSKHALIPSLIFCSPLKRAQETAHLLIKHLSISAKLNTVPWLEIENNPFVIINELTVLSKQGLDDIWLVGHEPDFSAVIGLLIETSPENLLIKKASLTRIDAEFNQEPRGTLLWSVPNKLM